MASPKSSSGSSRTAQGATLLDHEGQTSVSASTSTAAQTSAEMGGEGRVSERNEGDPRSMSSDATISGTGNSSSSSTMVVEGFKRDVFSNNGKGKERGSDDAKKATVNGEGRRRAESDVDEDDISMDPETAARAAQSLETRRQTQLMKQNKFTKASVIIPPENFAIVEEGLYRSAQPTELNFPFLQRLHLKTLLWLAPEKPYPEFLEFLEEQGIVLHHLGLLQSIHAWDAITEEVVRKALNLLLRPEVYPVMVMCNLGRHRTGTVIGCLRKLQRWNLASIFEEYRRHAGTRVRLNNEQFIELFDTDQITIPNPYASAPQTEEPEEMMNTVT